MHRYYRFVLALVRVIGVANIDQAPLDTWQGKVWDPKVGSKAFDEFCALLNSAWGFPVSVAAQDLEYGHPDRMVSLSSGLTLDFSILKYASWIKDVGGPLLYAFLRLLMTAYSTSYRNVHPASHRKTYVAPARRSQSADQRCFSASDRIMIPNTKIRISIKIGDCGNSKFALNGATLRHVHFVHHAFL